MKTKGQKAYEEDCARMPLYHTGEPRKKWVELDPFIQADWERNPTPRVYAPFQDVSHETAYGSTQRLSFAVRVF
jgi:hypothetical protein